MSEIRADLLRLIALNLEEKWVPPDEALEQLTTHGEALIPGLVAALNDPDDDVRLLAVELLHEAGPRAEAAVPALVNKVADPDRLVRVAAALALPRFGALAVAAVPLLEPWLEDANEYLRVIAATTILALDPAQDVSLLPKVKEGLFTEHPVVRSVAQEFFDNTPATITESAKAKMAGLRPTDPVKLMLLLNDVHLWPQEERRLHELGCTFFVQTAFVAGIEVPVEQVEEVSKLPSVKEIR
jgi:HEAT repeat protein